MSVPTTVVATTAATTSTTITQTTTRSSTPSSALDALTVLQTIPIEREHRGGYNRDLFAVWSDLDGDGCDTRVQVLRDESTTPAVVDHCDVVSGQWVSRYDGATVTDPSRLDIDHVVPLKEAWDSGAWAWSPERRIAFANDVTDPRTLAAVTATSNRSKGDADPSNWLPDAGDVCTYIGDWIAIKARWSLSMDASEWGRLKNLLNGPCVGTSISPWPESPVR